MFEIKAIIQPFMLDEVLHALSEVPGLPGLTVSHVLGWGRSRAAGAQDTVAESGHSFAKKVKIELVVPASLAEPVVTVLKQKARSGNPGDGKIFVYPVHRAVRIRTGEEGSSAL